MPVATRPLRLLPAAPPHLHGWPRPWGGPRPAVFHRVHSWCYRAADRKPRTDVRNPAQHVPQYGTDRNAQRGRGTDLLSRGGSLTERVAAIASARIAITMCVN